MAQQPTYGGVYVPGFGWGSPVKPLDTPTAEAFDSSKYNPWYAKVAAPTFVEASIEVPETGYKSPPSLVADVETVLGQNLDRDILYIGGAPMPPTNESDMLNDHLTRYPSLDTPQARRWGSLADGLMAMGRAANPSIAK